MQLSHAIEALGRHEALLMFSHFTQKDRAQAYLYENTPLPDEISRAFFNAINRRKNGEPLQYILGEWDFYGLTFTVDRRALIPRQETELLVEEIIKRLKPWAAGPHPARFFGKKRGKKLYNGKVLDVCTGGGCIAVALAVVLGVEVVAVDLSGDALSLALENALRHGVGERVRFLQSDLAAALLEAGENWGAFDVVVSNPPYIPGGDMAGLQREVRDFEPHLALDGGADGMDLYRRLLPQALSLLKPGGGLFLEIGPAQVADLAHAAGFCDVRLLNDYAGLPRMVCAAKGGNV